jgi:F0F1-type ATP synthase beta subunit
MTATVAEGTATAPSEGGVGRISRIIGPVVDVEFPADAMPEQYNLLTTDVELDGEKKNIYKTVMFETGIKVIDLLTPYVQGGKIGLFGGAGVGKTVLIQEMIARVAREPRWCVGVRRRRRAHP